MTFFNRRGLREQFAVLVAAANDVPAHSLYRLAKVFPRCVPFLVELKAQRDQSAHASSGPLQDRVAEVAGGLYRCVRALLPGMREESASGSPTQAPAPAAGVEVIHKLRAIATLQVERRVGIGVREHPDVQRPLVEMQMRGEELRRLRDQEGAAADPRGRLTSLVVKGCAAVEAALQALLRQAGRPADAQVPGADKRESARFFVAVAREVDFALQEGTLPEHLVTVPRDRLLKTVRSGNGTLNALALVLLLGARHAPDHPLRAIAASRPDFLLEVASLSGRRGHGDQARIAPHEAGEVTDTVLALVHECVRHLT
jgi:hypothetical protein